MARHSCTNNLITRLSRSFARFYCIVPMTKGLRSPVLVAWALVTVAAVLFAALILVPLILIFGYSRRVTISVVLVSLLVGVLVGEHAFRAIESGQDPDNISKSSIS